MAKEAKEVLKLVNVSKIYDMGAVKLSALDKVSFTVHEGELICVLGPSGSGKSTLLHIMGLLDTPTSGARYIDNIDTTRMSEPDQAKVRGRKIGFVFQRFNLIPNLTAAENVELPMVLADIPNRKQKARKILESLGMSDRLDHYP